MLISLILIFPNAFAYICLLIYQYSMLKMDKKAVLLILDGWGYGNRNQGDAVFKANTPFFDYLLEKYPNAKLQASGEAVGLPVGQMGNSEVGHMNLGAGRVVYQELGRINQAIVNGELAQNFNLLSALQYAKSMGKSVHFIGLVSDGGVHAHINHLKALIDICETEQITNSYIHAFLDGRDTDPNKGLSYISDLEDYLKNKNTELASLVGRYYAMDRDNRWERIKLSYDLMVKGFGIAHQDPIQAIKNSYAEGITDEFLKPVVIVGEDYQPKTTIAEGDVVICFNFRTDRGREITTALSQQDFPDFEMHKLNLHYLTMTSYDESFKGVKVLFEKDDLKNTLGEVLEKAGKNQIRIAETEKYPHVTFFFSGGREKPFKNEKRLLIPSPKVATYDLQPEMSADQITAAILPELKSKWADFICLNFANPDMVGHTGVFGAVIKAVEKVDACLKEVVHTGIENGYSFLVLADHGNAEYMLNDDLSVNTAHTTNLVPCILIDKDFHHLSDGKLGDIAPSILKILGIQTPEEMTGSCIVF